MKTRLKILVPLIVLAGVVGWFVFVREPSLAEGVIQASGTVEATSADLGFQIPGRVETITVREGDLVESGAELAVLDTRELLATRNAAEARVGAAEAQLSELRSGGRPQEIAQAEAVVRRARERADESVRESERAARLEAGGAISRQALEQARTAAEMATAQAEEAEQALALLVEGPRAERIRAQEAVVEQARSELARVEASLANAAIRAPFAGRITVRHREPGEIVGAGVPVLTLLDPNDRWVRIYVRADEIGRVQIGMPASIKGDTNPDERYEGEVVFIGSEAEFTPRNVQTQEERTRLVYPVKIRVTGDPDFMLKPGIPADVELRTEVSPPVGTP